MGGNGQGGLSPPPAGNKHHNPSVLRPPTPKGKVLYVPNLPKSKPKSILPASRASTPSPIPKFPVPRSRIPRFSTLLKQEQTKSKK